MDVRNVLIVALFAGIILIGHQIIAFQRSKCLKKDEDAIKFKKMFQMMLQWVILKQSGYNLSEYFILHGYRHIAIYGMSTLGELLKDELEDTDIEVVYGIDKKAKEIYTNIDVFVPNGNLPEADLVVVTAVAYFDDIKNDLVQYVQCPILSLEDILYDV